MEKVKYLIFGNGYLGNKFKNFLESSAISDVKIKGEQDAASEIIKYDPEIVLNCIGKTGRPNIDWCEDNKLETLDANTVVPVQILKACQTLNKKMVHLGSGCMFEGDNGGKGFSEEDEPNFHGSYYTKTKIWSEKMLKEFDNLLIIRLRIPTDSDPHPRNLINKLLKYNKVLKVDNSISVLDDMLNVTKELMDKNHEGIFNVVNEGTIRHDEILAMFEEATGKKLDYELISPEQLDNMTKARRSNCVLSTKKLESIGIKVPSVHEAMKKCVNEYAKNLGAQK